MAEQPEVQYLRGPTPHNGPIFLAEADPGWADQYGAEEARIRAALGDTALRVEHVGSTSVPDLAAKPVLDIVLLVEDSSNEGDYVPALEALGYVLHLREPGWQEHRLLRLIDPAVNLHVFGSGSEEPQRMLMFRDWLRTHPEDRSLYESVKQQLAAQHWERVQDYADAKTDVVTEILDRAARRRDDLAG